MHESANKIKNEHYPGWGSSKSTWYIFSVGLALVLTMQIGTAISVLRGSNDMREILSQTQQFATELQRTIGYGGLIHNFKNYLLRPDEDHYRIAVLANASRARVFIANLQFIGDSLGIDPITLSYTADMLNGYSARLEKVREFALHGRSARYIDEQVRFDDQPALQEVGQLIDQLSSAINNKMANVYRRGIIISVLGTLGTAAFGLLLTIVVVRRQQRYNDAIAGATNQLEDSNTSLTSANTSLNQFAGIVSHDLKSPIRAISIYNHMIADDIDDTEVVLQHVDGIEKSIDKITVIVDSLLEFTKVGFSPPELIALDLKSLFDRIEKGFELEIDKNSTDMQFRAEIDEPVLADPDQLSRVLFHLIDNGQKFAFKNKPASISIHAYAEGDYALIAVTDDGIGIDPRCAERIFEPLKCLHGPGSEYEGTGIGLSLVRSIAQGHGGKAWLDTSYHPDTRFVFSIPLAR